MLRKTNCYIPELEPIDFIFQLFVGTVAFTVLLFLYPTTLMYFSVFKSVESVRVSAVPVIDKMFHPVQILQLSKVCLFDEVSYLGSKSGIVDVGTEVCGLI